MRLESRIYKIIQRVTFNTAFIKYKIDDDDNDDNDNNDNTFLNFTLLRDEVFVAFGLLFFFAQFYISAIFRLSSCFPFCLR